MKKSRYLKLNEKNKLEQFKYELTKQNQLTRFPSDHNNIDNVLKQGMERLALDDVIHEKIQENAAKQNDA